MATILAEPVPPPPPPAPVPHGWEGLLAPGERILWQGRPQGGVVWSGLIDPRTPFGAVFAGFSIFWVATAATLAPRSGGVIGMVFPLFGLPFVAVGLYLLAGRLFWDAYLRSVTHYTLTDRAAFIATAAFGRRRLERVELQPGMRLTLDEGAPGSVLFGAGPVRFQNGRRQPAGFGFRRIGEARQVYGMMARIVTPAAP